MKILITGITGFAGSHLAEYCLQQNDEVFGICRWRSSKKNLIPILNKIKLIDGDIRDASSMNKIISKEIKPDVIFHLAAQSFVPTSWQAPDETLSTNIIGTLNVLEAVKELNGNCKVLLAGSSEEYGMVYENEVPIKETNPLRPISPYGVSKVGTDLLGYQYYKSYNVPIIRTRAFNHSGKYRPDSFVLSGFVKAFVETHKSRNSQNKFIIKHGNLGAIRDFVHVKDVVEAYYKLILSSNMGDVFNISTEIGWKIQDAFAWIENEAFFRYGEMNYVVYPDQSKMRPSDVPILIGDSTKLFNTISWKTTLVFKDIINDLFDYWENELL